MAARTGALLLLPALAPGAGCDPDRGLTEPQRYLAAVEDPDISLDRGRSLCGSLSDPELAGECMLAVVSAVGRRGDGHLETLCAEVPAGVWGDECWFLAAEGAARAGRREDAARLCLQSGRFVNDCGQHLWQSEVRAIIAPRAPGAPVPSFEEALPRARRVYDRWAPLLEEGTDMSYRFWRRFYQNGFERRGWISLRRCDPLEPEDRARCVDAGQRLFAQRVDMDLPAAGFDLCRIDDMTPQVAQVLRAHPHPALVETLRERQAARCGGGGSPGSAGAGEPAEQAGAEQAAASSESE